MEHIFHGNLCSELYGDTTVKEKCAMVNHVAFHKTRNKLHTLKYTIKNCNGLASQGKERARGKKNGAKKSINNYSM